MAAGSPATDAIADIVVTAQKREQSSNSVGLSVQALGAGELTDRNIRTTDELVKAVPGLTFTQSPYATPVYTLRGVGLYDSSLAASPSVSVYVDEVPLSFPIEQKAAALDVARVEVLKGPQGTLFGESSTGGAINYIAAKPTKALEAGFYGSVSDYGEVDSEGYLSGPLSDTLRARAAVRVDEGGKWQRSTSRGDKLGNADLIEGRLLLDWTPTDTIKFAVNLNGYLDHSDPLAPSLIRIAPFNPALQLPGFSQSIPAQGVRDADWPAGQPRRNNRFGQVALRGDINLSSTVTLTALSSYQSVRVQEELPQSGTPFPYQNTSHFGFITSYNEEVRLSGSTSRLNWLAGGSYEHVKSADTLRYDQTGNTVSQPIPFIPPFKDVVNNLQQTSRTYAFFGNADYKLTDHLSARAGVRYTNYVNRGLAQSYDDQPSDELGQVFQVLQLLVKGSFVPIPTGSPVSLDANFNPGAAHPELHESNVSFRAGADYKFDDGTLAYVTLARGYKAGIFSILAASRTSQFDPAPQERLDAYEAGIKAPLFDRRLQLNAAAFYYDYRNKQFRGSFVDPVFGRLERETNFPKSRVAGLEIEAIARPLQGLSLSAGATYLNTRVLGHYQTFTSDGTPLDAGGSRIPFTPAVTFVGDGEYQHPISSRFDAFVGAGVTYHSDDSASLHTSQVAAPDFRLKPYTLVDLRAGFQPTNGSWRATLWVRNASDVLRVGTVFRTSDDYFRYQDRPRTIGLSFRYNYK